MTGGESRLREAADAFSDFVELSPEEARSRLEALDAADPALARLVREMLAADAAAGAFLEGGAAEYSTRLSALREEPAPQSGSAAGSAVGPYVLVSLLGRGGMGEVWVADRSDGQFEQRVALKLLRAGIDSEGIRRRFVQERQLLARLDHPNIARLLDGGDAEGRPFFVLELVEGEPITEFARARGLTVEQRLRLVATCCDAVDAAHRRLVVHRDIKPSNVLVTRDGVVKLLDFGIAKVLSAEGDADYTQVGERVLTPSYAAPEQLAGEPVTTATDVYGLGVLLYRLLTGVLPHARGAAAAGALSSAVESETIERPSRAVASADLALTGFPAGEVARLPALLADDLDAIILKALRREPDRRYPGAAALGEDLRRHLAGLRVEARPDTLSYRAGKFIRRHRAGVAAGTLTLLTLLAGLAGTLWQARRAQANARRAERVQEFLVRLFQGSDPSNAREGNPSARDLLAEGTGRIEAELRGEPEVQAALYDVVARIHRALGSIPEAQRLAERSMAQRRQTDGEDAPVTAQSRLTLAEVRYSKGDVEAAESALRALLPRLAAAYGADSLETIRARDTLAAALLDEGKVPAALAMMQEDVASRRRRFGPDNPETGRGIHLLGQMQEAANHYAEAAAAYAVRRRHAHANARRRQPSDRGRALQPRAGPGLHGQARRGREAVSAGARGAAKEPGRPSPRYGPDAHRARPSLRQRAAVSRRPMRRSPRRSGSSGRSATSTRAAACGCWACLSRRRSATRRPPRGSGGAGRLSREARCRRTSSRSRPWEISATCTCGSGSWMPRRRACANRSPAWKASSVPTPTSCARP